MKTRIEFMMPNLEASIQVRGALLAELVEIKDIHFLANEETDLADLNVANAVEGSNLLHEGEKGLLYGMGFGLLAGLYVLFFPSWLTTSPTWYSQSPWYVVLMVTISLGAIFTAIGAAFLGVNIFNTDLKQYKNRIGKGEILMIVSADLYRVPKIRRIVKDNLKNADANKTAKTT
jgi:hypothetical protein